MSADNTPDFDKMSPEELMAWMETLAERQGAVEGFTTAQRMEIPEIDPNTVQDTGPGYIPYGMTPEEWETRKAKEEEEKARRLAERAARQPAGRPEPAAAKPIPMPAAPPPAAKPTPKPTPAPVTPPVTAKPVAKPAPKPTPMPAAPSPMAKPAPRPTPAPAAPVPEATPMAAAMPDFDKMTQEEMMAWMETLAERQGAIEGFTTEKRVEIAEVNPEAVTDAGPGYIPYGKTEEEWAAMQAKEEAEKQRRRAERAQRQLPLKPEPAKPEPVAAEPQFELPQLEAEIEMGSTEVAPAMEGGDLAWLEGLVPDQVGSFPQIDVPGLAELDFAQLGQGLEAFDLEKIAGEPVEEGSDPMLWLEKLAEGQGVTAAPTQEAPSVTKPPRTTPVPVGVTDPTEAGVDPMEWLESLAQQQGVSTDELITDAKVTVPPPVSAAPLPEYPEYAVEAEAPGFAVVDALDKTSAEDDPSAWLDSLASSVGQPPSRQRETPKPAAEKTTSREPREPETEAMLNKLDRGISDPSDIARWMDQMLTEGAARTDIPDYIETEEEEKEAPIEANIPDWLIEQVGAPPPDFPELAPAPMPTAAEAEPAPVASLDWLDETPAAEVVAAEPIEMPDWLKAGVPEERDELPEDIFAPPTPVTAPSAAPVLVGGPEDQEIDVSDPWVEAFELERREGPIDPKAMPDWYAEKLGQKASAAPSPLAAAQLAPETELPAGESEAIPAWLAGQPTPAALPTAVTEAAEEAMPDWLKAEAGEPVAEAKLPDWLSEAGVEEAVEVPDWLLQTADIVQPPVAPLPVMPTPPRPQPVFTPPAPTPTPRPVVSPAPSAPITIDVAETLQSARNKIGAGDLGGSLADYEAMVRANAELDTVAKELKALTEKDDYKRNAALHRVLGDSLMRQGRLQEALNTYRRALNLL